ncbi:MAG TPA: molybdopterin-guanine dinucleotide biosynthesis protein B [Bacillales bacterium]|nr:molybdopterin-guanine dinucleotide biosynthesis protein B [Bacillales bacterium]
MTKPLVVQVVGYKNSGKTTLVAKLVSRLKQSGFRVGTLKHCSDDFEMDQEGTDTWKHRQAGAEAAAIVSKEKTAFLENREVPVEQLLGRMSNLDVVVLEGFKQRAYPKVVIARSLTDWEELRKLDNIAAVASTVGLQADNVPVFSLDDIENIYKTVLNQLQQSE